MPVGPIRPCLHITAHRAGRCLLLLLSPHLRMSGMENVNGGRCAGPDCSKQPRFALPGNKGKFCSKHREEGMVDVLYTVS